MTTDEKLDYLIGKVAQLENEIQKLKLYNEKSAYSLETKFREIFRDLRDNISHMDSANYKYYSGLNGIVREVERRVNKVEETTPLNQFITKILPWSPAILIGSAIWALVIYVILS